MKRIQLSRYTTRKVNPAILIWMTLHPVGDELSVYLTTIPSRYHQRTVLRL